MKKQLVMLMMSFSVASYAHAENLLQAYTDALTSDPTFQSAIAKHFSDQEGVPINVSALLPAASISGGPSVGGTHYVGNPSYGTTSRGYGLTLNVSQTIFDFSKFANVQIAQSVSHAAEANLNVAAQDLILRTAKAYFAVLKDNDNLVYIKATKNNFYKSLDQANQEYKVGLKTITDVYTARASYDAAVANYIGAQAQLSADKENLRAITGVNYHSLSTLSEKFPLISPVPRDPEEWVTTARRQNWAIKSAEFAKLAALQNVKVQIAGHLPTLNLTGSYGIGYNHGTNSSNNPDTNTPENHTSTTSLGLNVVVPIFQGGYVTASVRKAKYDYQNTSQQFEKVVRDTVTLARISYLNVLAGIKKIQADKQAIKSAQSSLAGMLAGYRVGTEILINVLNQQEKVYQAQTTYATDRYDYLINLLTLKNAAGTLSIDDLQAVNAWLR